MRRQMGKGKATLRLYIVKARMVGLHKLADEFAGMSRRQWKEKLHRLIGSVNNEVANQLNQKD